MVLECAELGFIEITMLNYFRIEQLEGREEVRLVCIIECLAKVQVLQLITLSRTRREASAQ